MEWQDAAGLSQLSQSVEDVFSSGNLPKAAETLATMRHCLSAVGEVLYFVCGLMCTVYISCSFSL
jgi:conserved oligomeric Golgi complex subunit 7